MKRKSFYFLFLSVLFNHLNAQVTVSGVCSPITFSITGVYPNSNGCYIRKLSNGWSDFYGATIIRNPSTSPSTSNDPLVIRIDFQNSGPGNYVFSSIMNGFGMSKTLSYNFVVGGPPSLASISPEICVGTMLNTIEPWIGDNGSAVTSKIWSINGIQADGTTVITSAYNNVPVFLQVSNTCGTSNTNTVTLKVNGPPSISNFSAPAEMCAGNYLNLTTPTVLDNGSTITGQGWYLGNSAFNPAATIITSEYNGQILSYRATNACGTTMR